jgi:hypothetical protein
VASAAYITAYQLTWLSRIAGQRQNALWAVRWIAWRIRAAVRSGSPSARRAR